MSHVHTWTVAESTRLGVATQDAATLECCSECPALRAIVYFDPSRDRTNVRHIVDLFLLNTPPQRPRRDPELEARRAVQRRRAKS